MTIATDLAIGSYLNQVRLFRHAVVVIKEVSY